MADATIAGETPAAVSAAGPSADPSDAALEGSECAGAVLTATSEWTKSRTNVPSDAVGAVAVDEAAPHINRRFYRGHNRASERLRRARARSARRRGRGGEETGPRGPAADPGEGAETAVGAGAEDPGPPPRDRRSGDRRRSAFGRMFSRRLFGEAEAPMVSATLVEEGEVVEAERLGFFERRGKSFAFVLAAVFLLALVLAIVMAIFFTRRVDDNSITRYPSISPTETTKYPSISPTMTSRPSSSMGPSALPTANPSSSMQPSSKPSFDTRPTLEIVQTRGHVRCGLTNATIESGMGFRLDLCRAVASVVFGDPDSFIGVPVTGVTRFPLLNGRDVDLLLLGDTHTIERDVRERRTGAGFTFSSTYYYDGMAYFGVEHFVRCAEKHKRYNGCSSLVICVASGSTSEAFVKSSFPPGFYLVAPSSIETMTEMLLKDECNVIASDRTVLLTIAVTGDDRIFIVGDKLETKEPLAIVTRNDDREFSDTINWVVQALFYGEEQGITKNSTLCQNYTSLTHHASDLHFMNAVYCVGNYYEILDGDKSSRGMNQINNGTGMLYATPFGDLDFGEDRSYGEITIAASLLDDIRKRGSLSCGVVVPDGFVGRIRKSDKLVGMSVEYCRTLAAALFYGDIRRINVTSFSESDDSSFAALQNGTLDILAGRRVEKKYDFESSSSGKGFHFSTPYYHGYETASDHVSFFSLATREDDALFSSFVNCIVLATIYAEENDIKKTKSKEMPLSSIFGGELTWALRDAIAYSGSYREIYFKNFLRDEGYSYGRNMLNEDGTPQLHSFPGLSQ